MHELLATPFDMLRAPALLAVPLAGCALVAAVTIPRNGGQKAHLTRRHSRWGRHFQ